MESKLFNLAIVVSHPIQHFCPQYASFSKLPNVKVRVFFASMLGLKSYADKGFGQNVSWNNLKLDEFDHIFVNGDQVLPSSKDLTAPTMGEELAKFHPDAIITYGYFQKFQRECHKWAKRNNVPLAYITDAENRQHRPWLKRAMKYFALRWYFKKIDYFFTVGDANEAYYNLYGVPSNKFIRMHYPIDINVYENAFQNKKEFNEEIRSKFDIPEDDFVISVVGKLVAWKNQDHLIDLLVELEKQQKKAHVLIIGSGETLDAVKQKAQALITNKAHFPGFVTPLDLPKYYAASDLYLHPARVEPHSLAISEAIFMGCPVVLSDRCGSYGATDDVQIGNNGEVYNFGDIQQMATKVIPFMEDKQMHTKFSKLSILSSRKFQKRSHGGCVLELIERLNSNK